MDEFEHEEVPIASCLCKDEEWEEQIGCSCSGGDEEAQNESRWWGNGGGEEALVGCCG